MIDSEIHTTLYRIDWNAYGMEKVSDSSLALSCQLFCDIFLFRPIPI